MREYGSGENNVKMVVLVRKTKAGCRLAPARVVSFVIYIYRLEPEIRELRSNMFGTPFYAVLIDIETVVGACCIQISSQRYGHSATSTSQIQYTFMRLQSSQLFEVDKKGLAHEPEVAFSYKINHLLRRKQVDYRFRKSIPTHISTPSR